MGRYFAGAGDHADDSVHHGCEHGSQQPLHGAFGQDKRPCHHHRLSGHHANPSSVDSATDAGSALLFLLGGTLRQVLMFTMVQVMVLSLLASLTGLALSPILAP